MPLASTSAIHCWTISSDQVDPVPSIWAYVVRSLARAAAPVGGGRAGQGEQAAPPAAGRAGHERGSRRLLGVAGEEAGSGAPLVEPVDLEPAHGPTDASTGPAGSPTHERGRCPARPGQQAGDDEQDEDEDSSAVAAAKARSIATGSPLRTLE